MYPIVLYIIMELRSRRFKNVCYFDLRVAMVTIQSILLAKQCNKRNSKTKRYMLTRVASFPRYGKITEIEHKTENTENRGK